MFYFKIIDGSGKPSYCTSTDETAIPEGATRFVDAAAYNADMLSYVLAQRAAG